MRTKIFVQVTEKTIASICQHVYNHLIRLPMSFFSERRVGAKSPADMGKVMGVATKELAGKADGKEISAKVKQLLG